MNITIFGATGKIGRLVVERTLARGHQVTAHVRNPQKLALTGKNLSFITGDILDAASVADAVKGAEAVICTLGMPLFNNDGLRARGTRHIVDAMQKQNIKRLICLSSFGAGDSYQFLPFMYKYIIGPLFMRRLFADHGRQEQIIMESSLDWTIVRPGSFTGGEATGTFKHGAPIKDARVKAKISQPDIAAFITEQLTSLAYLRKAPVVSY